MSGNTLLEKVDCFFEDMRAALGKAQTEWDDPVVSPRFNAIKAVELFPICENTLSYVIANLLNPTGKHAQGPAFLNAFLKVIHAPEALISIKTVEVIREAVTTSIPCCARRMDILIHSDSGAVMIENKPLTWIRANR